VSGIHGNGCENRLDCPGIEIFDVLASFGTQIAAPENAHRFSLQRRNEFVAPALILLVHEAVDFRGELGEHLLGDTPVGARLTISVFGLLH
jgi:hypothetical protein